MNEPKIVVCGATGNQGGAVAASLLKLGLWKVVALTRDPGSDRAKALAAAGAEIVRADLLDMASLRQAFAGADGVFGLVQPWSAERRLFDPSMEMRQGKNIIWACREAGVRQVVLSTILNLGNEQPGVSYIDGKFVLEELFRKFIPGGVIIRPALYMENIGCELINVSGGIIRGRFAPDVKVPYLSLQDLGRFVVSIFVDYSRYRNGRLDLASDLISGHEVVRLLNEFVPEKKLSYRPADELLLRLFKPEFYRMRRFFERQSAYVQTYLLRYGCPFFLPALPVSKLAYVEANAARLLNG